MRTSKVIHVVSCHAEGEVGVAAGDQAERVRAPGAFDMRVEPGGDVGDVDAGMITHCSRG